MLASQLRKTFIENKFFLILDNKAAQQLLFHLPAINIQIKKNPNMALYVPMNYLYKVLVMALKKIH